PAVSHVQEGERVAFIGAGSYGEYALAKEDSCFRLPDELSDELGAAFPIQGLTAYHILHTSGRCKPGEWVVVHAAAGGVGSLAIQLAKRAGLTVIATASTEEKLAFCREMGADHVHNYAAEDFMKGIRRITEGRGVDLVLDSVGQDTIRTNFRILSMFGRVVAYGLASGMPEVSVAKDLFPKSLGLQAFSLYNVLARPYRLKPSVAELIDLLVRGELKVRLEAILPLAEAEEAHRRLEGRSTMGKVLLEV
ncbi:MAG TPA: zinc-binding dehydrogenase, partial [bacterium]|nr:zinc-binding dehydrogenase [bacterium]